MSFKEYILNVHPDPDFLGDKKVYDAFDELNALAVNYAKDQNTRLRELVTQYLDNSTSDNAYGADVRTRILNELSPKP